MPKIDKTIFALLQLVLGDDQHFSPQVKRFLAYAKDNFGNSEAMSEAGIASKFLGLDDWDKRNANVRTLLTRTRDSLRDYFEDQNGGRKHENRLAIPNNPPYHFTLVTKIETDPVERFWQAHADTGIRNLIVTTEPLFFYDPEHRRFIRYLDINTDSLDDIPKQRHPETKHMIPCFHYQPSGEAYAARRIRRWFETRHMQAEIVLSRECNDAVPWSSNVFFFGNARTNRFLRQLQTRQTLGIMLRDYEITVPQLHGKGRASYKDLDPGTNYTYALLTRSPSKFKQYCATTIAANHGRAAQKVAEYLTSEATMTRFFEMVSVPAGQVLPPTFQVLFRVETHDFDLAAGDAEPLLWEIQPGMVKSANI